MFEAEFRFLEMRGAGLSAYITRNNPLFLCRTSLHQLDRGEPVFPCRPFLGPNAVRTGTEQRLRAERPARNRVDTSDNPAEQLSRELVVRENRLQLREG